MTRIDHLRAYMWTVILVAAPLVAFAVRAAVHGYSDMPSGTILAITAIFCVILIVGELWPIPVSRGRKAGDEITVSSTFGFGLLFVAPVFVAIAAQAVALTIDAISRRRPLDRLLFNIAQYAIAFLGARLVYALAAGRAFTPVDPVPSPDLLATVPAGLVFLLINNTLVAVAVSISVQMRLRQVLVDDLRWQFTTSAPLLGLGPLAVHAMMWTPAAIVLLLMPIVALHHSGTMAMRREAEALRDALTGLANRAMLHSAGDDALSKSTGGTALLLLDLDHFKDINDTLGHDVGDQMLRAVAQRLLELTGERDLVARLGGDEFVVLVSNVDDVGSVVGLAERLCATVREPVDLGGVSLTVGCSVGIALAPEHANTTADLLRRADIALYDAKVMRGSTAVYDKAADRHSAAHLSLHADLRKALEDPTCDQIWVAFMPQIDVATGAIRSVECLVRWLHPERGELGPDVFVPIAENTSLIDLLLARVLDRSLAELVAWERAGRVMTACVNLSARQLSDLSLPETIRLHLARHGVAPNRLVLEITETRLIADPERSAAIIRDLHRLGVQISVDDFGTGYSSLAYLQQLAVDELKIDKSFVMRMDDPDNATIVRSTIELGHNLGYRVVAEGVADEATAVRLAAMGCDVLQGFFVGMPVASVEFARVVAAAEAWGHGALPVWRDDLVARRRAFDVQAAAGGAGLRAVPAAGDRLAVSAGGDGRAVSAGGDRRAVSSGGDRRALSHAAERGAFGDPADRRAFAEAAPAAAGQRDEPIAGPVRQSVEPAAGRRPALLRRSPAIPSARTSEEDLACS